MDKKYSIKKTKQIEKNYYFSLIIFIIIFFSSGVITSMNDILIPKLKSIFNLSYFKSMLVQFCFFLAYFIISALYYLISINKKNLLLKIGYKNMIVIGLITSSIGGFLFYPATIFNTYIFFLGALFILASGITLLQIGVNPYITLLGNPETASSRLSLTQGFSSLGSTIGPLIGSILILNVSTISYKQNNQTGIDKMKIPYIIISILLFLIAIIIKNTNLPNINNSKNQNKNQNLIKKYRNLKYGIIAIFMYVGAEVSIDSLIIVFLSKIDNNINMLENKASQLLSLYWGGAMIGRFFGAIFLSKTNKKIKFSIILLILTIALYYSNKIINFNNQIKNYFWLIIIINIIAFFIGGKKSNKILSIFSLIVIILLLLGALSSPNLAIASIISIGLFNSIMFPTIFTLGVKDLKNDTQRGSSLLIMAIVGGAIMPLIQGKIADITNVQLSYLTPIICYLYIFFYGINGYKKNYNNSCHIRK